MGAPEWCIHLLPDALTYSGTAVQLAVLPSPQNKDIRGIAAGRRNLDSREGWWLETLKRRMHGWMRWINAELSHTQPASSAEATTEPTAMTKTAWLVS